VTQERNLKKALVDSFGRESLNDRANLKTSSETKSQTNLNGTSSHRKNVNIRVEADKNSNTELDTTIGCKLSTLHTISSQCKVKPGASDSKGKVDSPLKPQQLDFNVQPDGNQNANAKGSTASTPDP